MYVFAKVAIKLLNEYKSVLKKHLSRQDWTATINHLGLRRKTLRNDSETILFVKAQNAKKDLAKRLSQYSNPPSWYSGLDEFNQYFKNALDEYQLIDGKILNAAAEASRALVDAYQLMKMPNAKRDTAIAAKIENCSQIVAKFGSREQQIMFSKALKNYKHEDVNFFHPLIKAFEKHINDFTAFFEDDEEVRSS